MEKKYEESKPLVNLVDNMVKLGSFYNKNSDNDVNNSVILEQNQREQERRMFADEKKQWDRISPNPVELQVLLWFYNPNIRFLGFGALLCMLNFKKNLGNISIWTF